MLHRTGLGLFMSITLLAALPAFAQDQGASETPATPEEQQTDPATGLSTGEPATPQAGDTYVRETSGDWEVRCVKTDTDTEPCQMYQLLKDASGTPTSEIVLFKVQNGQIAAGATVVTPLETLLTRGLTMTITEGLPKRYPFNFCNQVGCVAQIGFTAEELTALKRGNTADLTIVPFRAQNTEVVVKMSLAGFTAAYDSLPVRGQ